MGRRSGDRIGDGQGYCILLSVPSAVSYSRLTYELEPQGESVKFTVIHEIEKTGSKLIEAVSGGWPLILASLKSLLETGAAPRTNPPLAKGGVSRLNVAVQTVGMISRYTGDALCGWRRTTDTRPRCRAFRR